MWKTTIRGLQAHKMRLVSTMLAVILGVAFMAGTLVFTDTVGKTFDDLFADIYAETDVVVRGEEQVDSPGFAPPAPLPESIYDQVAAVPEVATAVPYVEGLAQIVTTDGDPIGDPNSGAPTFGQSWVGATELDPWNLTDGAAPSGPDEVVIDRGSAKEGNIAVGDTVSVLTSQEPREFTVSGIIAWGEADSPLGASAAVWDLATAQEMLSLDGQLTSVLAVAADGVSQEAAADAVRAGVEVPADVITGTALTEESQNDLAEGLSFFNTFLLVFALVSLFVGSFIIYNTFSIVVAQRQRELALLRSLGATRRQVLKSVLIEALFVAVIASGLGLLAGVGLSFLLRGFMTAAGLDIPATGTVILPASMAVAFATGFVITMLAALGPALRGSRVPPIAALRDVSIDRSGTSRARVIAGALVLATGMGGILLGLFGETENGVSLVGLGAAITFVGVFILGPIIARPVAAALAAPLRLLRGTTGRLAGENARRNPKRTSATAVALTIGVSLVGFISIFAASATAYIDQTIDENFNGDLVLGTSGFGPGMGFSPELAAGVEAVPGVDTVAEVRFGIVEVDGETQFYSAVDPLKANRVFDIGIADGSIDELYDEGVAVDDGLAEDNGWALGDTLTVTFPETGDVELPLRATYTRADIAGPVVVGMGTHEDNTSAQLDLQALVKLDDSADADAVRAAVEDVAAAYPSVDVQDLTEYKESQSEQINQMLAMIYGLLFLAILIALIGIANTLTLSIHERTRELGLLRAVGLTRSQLRASVRWESVIVALFGTLLGLVIGVFFGWTMVRALASEGFDTFLIPVGQLATITVLAALAGVLAGIRPAWRASKLDILDAIAT